LWSSAIGGYGSRLSAHFVTWPGRRNIGGRFAFLREIASFRGLGDP
jgi:hypothetical protein